MPATSCPLCNGKRRIPTSHFSVFTCKRCGAIFGDCYLGDSYNFVKPFMAKEPVSQEKLRYYDLTCVGSGGVTRRHGWYDPETKFIHQVG